jgi:MFS family permease
MLAAAAVRAVCLVAIGGLRWLGILSAWEVYALALAFGVADAFALPAQTAYVPALLSEEQLVAGLSFGQAVEVVAYTVGPIPAGLAVSHFGTGPAFIIDAVGFLVVIAALLRLPNPPVAPTKASPISAIREGIAQVLSDAPLRTMMLLAGAANFSVLGSGTVGVAFLASSRLGSSTAYGVILSAEASGYLIGTLAGGAWKMRRRGLVILWCLGLLGLGLMSIPFLPSVWDIAAVHVAIGAVEGLSSLHFMAWIMQRVNFTFRGRISSVYMLSSLGMAPISMALSGFLATWSVTALFVLPGACLAAVALGAAVLPSVREIR